jgi:hypothetical protein
MSAIIASSSSSTFEGRVDPLGGRRRRAGARPKISVSSRELAPRRLPPWTETQAVSLAE